ncbi:PPR36 phosphatase, partial [Polyodon spathula]|nr:PPR36 phosphatase [Polyodon spathula]
MCSFCFFSSSGVAFNLLQENESLTIPVCFTTVMRSQQLNNFLSALLLYVSCYFEKEVLERKPKPLMAEQSLTERKAVAEACAKVEIARKQLALKYSILVLGLGMSQQHHMACGKKRNPKRPAIKSMINQRSPVIVSLLPSPKEKSQYLFKSHRLDQDKNTDSCDIKALVEELSAALSSK